MNRRTRAVLAAAVAAVSLCSQGASADDAEAKMDAAGRSSVTVTGHLQGACGYGDNATSCLADASHLTRLQLSLPRRVRHGSLNVRVESAVTNGGLSLSVLDADGKKLATSTGLSIVGYAGGKQQVEASVQLPSLASGRYSVELRLSAGVADFTESLTWNRV